MVKTFFTGKIYRMNKPTPDQIEELAAEKVVNLTIFLANHDADAAVGIILKAFELLTEDMTVKNKRALLRGETE